ncbi:MAG: response regulator, partial [Oscillospiraceae bacterium]|nr:response regulator [Oscillospiraceae bacterium]
MNPIPVVIADDDPGMRLVIRKILERSGDFTLLGEAEDGEALLTLVEQHRPFLVLLDVEMPRMTGVEAARVIQDTDPATLLIFTTAHAKYMGDAFSVYAFDYLIKPFKVDRALQTLDRVKRVFDTRQKAEGAPPIPVQPQRAEGRLML